VVERHDYQRQKGAGEVMESATIKCSICTAPMPETLSHNAEPLNNGRCCSHCNTEMVVPYRLLCATGMGPFLTRLMKLAKESK
jgi:hypothetical protein